jgi:hypothetical protein
VKPSDLNGEWEGPITLDRGTKTITLVFRLTDSTFTGNVYVDGDDFGAMEKGTVVDNKVHFNLDRLDFTGTVERRTMKVALVMYNGSTRELTLTRRAAPPAQSGVIEVHHARQR